MIHTRVRTHTYTRQTHLHAHTHCTNTLPIARARARTYTHTHTHTVSLTQDMNTLTPSSTASSVQSTSVPALRDLCQCSLPVDQLTYMSQPLIVWLFTWTYINKYNYAGPTGLFTHAVTAVLSGSVRAFSAAFG